MHPSEKLKCKLLMPEKFKRKLLTPEKLKRKLLMPSTTYAHTDRWTDRGNTLCPSTIIGMGQGWGGGGIKIQITQYAIS